MRRSIWICSPPTVTGPLDLAITGEMELRESFMQPRESITRPGQKSQYEISGAGLFVRVNSLQYRIRLRMGNTMTSTTRGGLRIPVTSQFLRHTQS